MNETRYETGYTVAIILLVLTILVLRSRNGDVAGGIGVALLGIMMLLHPCATPQTVEMVGEQKAHRLVRFLGVFTFLLGLVIVGGELV